jgi:putative membrane protein
MRITSRTVGTVATALALIAITPGPAGAAAPDPAPEEPTAACLEDVKYLYRAHRGNLAEEAAAEAALDESQNAQIRRIAKTLLVQHTKYDRTIVELAEGHEVALPPRATQKQRDDLAAVVALDGPEFDRAWLVLQVAAHKQTLDFIGRERDGGCAENVKAAAEMAEPYVQAHLKAVEDVPEPA